MARQEFHFGPYFYRPLSSTELDLSDIEMRKVGFDPLRFGKASRPSRVRPLIGRALEVEYHHLAGSEMGGRWSPDRHHYVVDGNEGDIGKLKKILEEMDHKEGE